MYDVAIVGAGFGGLAAGAELSRNGKRIIVLEASNELGGSAGKFDRDGYRFQSGATVGMGFEPGGVFDRLYHILGLETPSMTLLDPIMDIHMPAGTIHYYKEKERWFNELSRVFPDHAEAIQSFYNEVFEAGAVIDQMMHRLPIFPPKQMKDWVAMLQMVNGDSLKLLPYLTQTVEQRLEKYSLHQHQRFLTFLNGELMDSVQTSVDNCPAFLGYAALSTFHKGAYAVHGGLATIAEQLATYITAQSNEVLLRHPVRLIEKERTGFVLHSKRGKIFQAKQVIMNHSAHNLASTLSEDLLKKCEIAASKEEKREAWGAFIIHAGVDAHVFEQTESLYHQFIDPARPQSLFNGGQFLLSLSSPDDDKMAPEGKRSLTISTHTPHRDWWEAEDYERKKQEMETQLLTTVDHYFPGFLEGVGPVLSGTPITFQRWLHRTQGKVGGYVPTGAFSWLQSYSVRTGVRGLWMCGDTVFPGAGTLGVTLSGLTAARGALDD